MWFLSLGLAVVSRANGPGSKLISSRLAPESGDVEKRVDEPRAVPQRADNRSVVLHRADTDSKHHPEAKAAGSLTCMRWTGGSCRHLACREERGPFVTCEAGYCMCKPGTCADARGTCKPNFEGEWLGEYSIRFGKPFLPDRPFLGADKEGGGATGWAGANGGSGAVAWLAAVAASEKQWKIAQTPNGRVRLENTKHPGSVLTIYNNRRRSDFMQRKARHEKKNMTADREARHEKKKMSDDDDLWPVLMKLEAATPLAATFQIVPTMKNGGGYELWDPENDVSLASADPESWGDSVVGLGVTECYQESSWSSDPCEGGRHLIEFDPALPNKAFVKVHHAHIDAIGILTWWQTALLIGCCCCCAICFVSDEDNPNSKPLIVHTINAVGGAVESSREQRRAAEEERARERNAFAQKIAGFWVIESEMGNFEYELQKTPVGDGFEGISVHGRAQGISEWDSMFPGQLLLEVDQLSWDDDSGTKFRLTFRQDTCDGMASAGGKEVSLSGKRSEPPST